MCIGTNFVMRFIDDGDRDAFKMAVELGSTQPLSIQTLCLARAPEMPHLMKMEWTLSAAEEGVLMMVGRPISAYTERRSEKLDEFIDFFGGLSGYSSRASAHFVHFCNAPLANTRIS
jgi:hypothetical protein